MARLFITLGAFAGLLAVTVGAFGAHALRGRLDDYARDIFETAVQYHFYHSLALLAVGLLAVSAPDSSLLRSSGWLFVIGLFLFSGSLYALSLTGVKWLGAITPLGGLAFIAGWGCLAAVGWKLLP
ncbi:DUF423 domain-containing protein [Chromatocurvus halotolerans]|uniref:Uncharacterized membrane protein YgdD (TMEM256/DUF423 family) n=1 Tax=Chromatocurvus halotolerans TaxID=1132028 RepID=A0A4R2KMH3_9GAMM|nr:DUF423 domain-containing protein [Chromatocurvus halotolerans]TCO75301.1 uncharacterized membrane protein YgdD (TMEM256/DUF423 family) [Chromatocurvus halotolerans]